MVKGFMKIKCTELAGDYRSERLHNSAWADTLSCGHAEIDADHQHLLEIVERLQNTSAHEDERMMVGNLLSELLEYVQGHFAREESLMQAIPFPGYADHHFEHGLLTSRVRSMHHDFVNAKTIAPKEVWRFLRRWLRYHIMNNDIKMLQYLTMK